MVILGFSVRFAFGQISLGGDMEEIDYAEPQEYEVGGITISGVQYLDKNVLVMLSGISVGETIMVPGDKISKAIEKLWEQGLFENVRIVATKNRIRKNLFRNSASGKAPLV